MNIIPKEIDKFNNLRKEKLEYFLNEILQIVSKTNEYLEGNSFYEHQTFNRTDSFYNKQFNLFQIGSLNHIKNLCEIGFNAGHSALLFLIGRESEEKLNYTVFDINHHQYTMPCIEFISSKSANVDFNYIIGDSTQTMPEWIANNPSVKETYDLIHIDGGHEDIHIKNDFINSDLLVKSGGIIIIDDTDNENINNYVNNYINSGKYKEIFILPTFGYQHRIIQKI